MQARDRRRITQAGGVASYQGSAVGEQDQRAGIGVQWVVGALQDRLCGVNQAAGEKSTLCCALSQTSSVLCAIAQSSYQLSAIISPHRPRSRCIAITRAAVSRPRESVC